MRAFAAHDDAHARGPLAQHARADQPRQLGDVTALPDAAVSVQGRSPDLLRHLIDRRTDLFGDSEPDRVVHGAAADLTLLVQPVQQLVRGASTVGADQQVLAVGGGDLPDRLGQDLHVIRGRVRPGVPSPQRRGQELLGVVAPHSERVIPEGPFERRRCMLLLAVRDHDRGVHVQHHDVAQVAAGDLAGRHPAGELGPHMTTHPGPRGLDLLHPARGHLIQGAPHRRRRCDRSEHITLVTQHVDVGDRLTTIGEHDRHIGQDPATVMDRDETTPGHRLGQLPSQARSVGQQPQRDAARVGHHADTISRDRQPRRPRRTLHLPSASCWATWDLRQVQVFPAQGALRCFTTPTPGERSGLGGAAGLRDSLEAETFLSWPDAAAKQAAAQSPPGPPQPHTPPRPPTHQRCSAS